MRILGRCFGIIGILSIIYYIMITLYAGIKVSYGWLWLAAGIICIGLFAVFGKMARMTPPVIIFLIISGLVIIVFLCTEIWIIGKAVKKPDRDAGIVIVLGTQIKGTRITKALKFRLDGAVDYLKENEAAYAVVSGGRGVGEDISEAEAMGQYLIEHGIEEKRIIMEDKSSNTMENLEFSCKLLESMNLFSDVSSVKTVIVTNRFHVGRAVSIAAHNGFNEAEGLGVPSGSIMVPHYYVREALAVWKDVIAGHMGW